ncbi:hypothetical protein BG011_005669 [Mortierella polycephala]|uniref:Methylated-DNA--protein-cysteine methyltransferase n=1 Tax=Mortierella polycephala TaxID=41804 RepID=A0A9P6PUV6_9FUNG|nr:hypothetical protein BG011_005669 [Mortierella polycephala]
MPAERTIVRRTVSAVSAATLKSTKKTAQAAHIKNVAIHEPKKPVAVDEDISTVHPYPLTARERENAINQNTGRKITVFQFQVYDLCAQIPKGQISTYKHISEALQSSPRAVGQALKINPYAPLPVPCHRVLDSKLYIGGFSGQWGEGEKIDNKKAKLFHEGVVFDETDHVAVATRENLIFDGFNVPINKKIKVTAAI